jgi:hypothetical protein
VAEDVSREPTTTHLVDLRPLLVHAARSVDSTSYVLDTELALVTTGAQAS